MLHTPFPTHQLLIASYKGDQYRQWIEAAALPNLSIVEQPTMDCDILFGEPARIRELLPALPALRWAHATWAGVEPLLDPALRRDYLLTNARGVFGPLVSEYVFAYLLLHERKILQRRLSQASGQWDNTLTGTLRGKTLGLLGVGSIGAHLAGTGKPFGMRVLGYTRQSESCQEVDGWFHGDELPGMVRQVDYLVNTLPNTPATSQIIDARLLGALPPHALFINVGRGSAVDEPALAAALAEGRLAGAVLDVFQQEPLPPEHIFWRTPNLFITNHTAAPSFPADIIPPFAENYHRYLRGEPLRYQVDFALGY
jgi:phosphoglycerate dehydrogenase-like enzyme